MVKITRTYTVLLPQDIKQEDYKYYLECSEEKLSYEEYLKSYFEDCILEDYSQESLEFVIKQTIENINQEEEKMNFIIEMLKELTNEDFEKIKRAIQDEEKERNVRKRKELKANLQKAWEAIEKEGLEIWLSGNYYTHEEDIPLNFNSIYLD